MATNLAEKLDLREGTNQAKLANKLPKGKPVKVTDLLKTLYGNTKDENRGALNNALGGFAEKLAKKKAGKLERDVTADTVTLK